MVLKYKRTGPRCRCFVGQQRKENRLKSGSHSGNIIQYKMHIDNVGACSCVRANIAFLLLFRLLAPFPSFVRQRALISRIYYRRKGFIFFFNEDLPTVLKRNEFVFCSSDFSIIFAQTHSVC